MVIDSACEARQYRSGELAHAVAFFEETTGIPARGVGYSYGAVVLSPDFFAEDVARWGRWHAKNGGSLVFDSVTGRVLVDECARHDSTKVAPHCPRAAYEFGKGPLSYQLENWPGEEFLVGVVMLDGEHVASVFRRGEKLELTIYQQDPGKLELTVDDLEDLLHEMRQRMLD